MTHTISLKNKASRCSQQDIWLIPGKADVSCSRPGIKKIIEVDSRQIVIRPKIVKLPGCFNLEIKNIRVLDNHDDAIVNSFFAKIEYQWWNVKDFEDLKCQNASNNGCGGYGNNCYYCDICESLHQLQLGHEKSAFTDQLKGISCPKYPGYYTFR
ncbi:Glycoprotein 3-alpha-L-fucosyltransferase [Dirofilaria immitis]